MDASLFTKRDYNVMKGFQNALKSHVRTCTQPYWEPLDRLVEGAVELEPQDTITESGYMDALFKDLVLRGGTIQVEANGPIEFDEDPEPFMRYGYWMHGVSGFGYWPRSRVWLASLSAEDTYRLAKIGPTPPNIEEDSKREKFVFTPLAIELFVHHDPALCGAVIINKPRPRHMENFQPPEVVLDETGNTKYDAVDLDKGLNPVMVYPFASAWRQDGYRVPFLQSRAEYHTWLKTWKQKPVKFG